MAGSRIEEADTRMLLHAQYAAGQCQEAKIVIQSPDTDVLVLSAAHFEDIASRRNYGSAQVSRTVYALFLSMMFARI